MIRNLFNLLAVHKVALTPAAPATPKKKSTKFSQLALDVAASKQSERKMFMPPKIMPGVIPVEGEKRAEVLAMDYALQGVYNYANTGQGIQNFPGYPYLAELAQVVEYRKLAEIPAKEMTRKWIKITSKGDKDLTDKITKIDAVLKAMNVRGLFRDAMIHDGLFGRGQIYIDLNGPRNSLVMDDEAELKLPMLINPAKIPLGSLRGFKLIDPTWTYPYAFNSDKPLRQDFYRPQAWFVMGQEVHHSRLLNFISRPLPDMLKPAYVFGGISMSQLAQPYVNNWIRARNSISDMVHSFSVSGLKTNLATLIQEDPSGNSLFERLAFFNMSRDNRGTFAIDKDTEEFFQFNTPLSGLDALQTQAIEMLCYVSNIPPVKLFGSAASGLNASDEGTIKVFYDSIHSEQEDVFTHPLSKIFEVIQMSEFGVIDPDIGFEFEPLWEPNGKELAEIRKSDADGAVAMVGAGILSPEEVRTSLAADPTSGYESINVSEIPDPPEPPDMGNLDDDEPDDEAPKADQNNDA